MTNPNIKKANMLAGLGFGIAATGIWMMVSGFAILEKEYEAEDVKRLQEKEKELSKL